MGKVRLRGGEVGKVFSLAYISTDQPASGRQRKVTVGLDLPMYERNGAEGDNRRGRYLYR